MRRRGQAALVALAMLVIGVVPSHAAPPQDPINPTTRSIAERLMGGGRVINIVDDFLNFWEQARTQRLSRQRVLFKRLVESKHRDYFERAVYRGADRAQKRAMLNEFLIRVPERIEAIRELNDAIRDPRVSPLVDALLNFRIWFREFRPTTDIYIGLSLFRFDGSIRAIGNDDGIPDTLCLGTEVLAGYEPAQVRVALAHELFHLYHFSFLFAHPSPEEFRTAHIPLMVEGMAVAASELLYPNLERRVYLRFEQEQLAEQEHDLGLNAASFLELMMSAAPSEVFESWFTGRTEDVPVRGGYLLGQEVTRRLLATYTLEELAQMNPAQLKEHAEEELAAIALVPLAITSGGE